MQPGPAGGGGLSQAVYYAKNIVAAAANGNTVTVKLSAAAPLVDVRILEYSGVDTVNPLDGSSAAVGNSATADAGPLTTTNANDLLVGARNGPPLAVGYGNGEMYLGSDAIALSPFTDSMATPPTTGAVPSEVAPSRNSTVPVEPEGLTVALNVTLVPKLDGLLFEVRAVEVPLIAKVAWTVWSAVTCS